MSALVELVPLQCIRCETPVPAAPEEVAWVCSRCGQGLALDESKGLVALEINYQAGLAPDAVGKPFWVVNGRVSLQRDTYSGDQREDAERFWGSGRRFVLPAFAGTLDNLISLSMRYLQQPPALQPGQPARFEPVTLARKDLQAAAEYLVMAVEAARKDNLKLLGVRVELSEPALWILP